MIVSYNFELHHVKRANGEYPVLIRITQNRSHIRRRTGIKVSNRSYFNAKAKSGRWISKSDPEYKIKNKRLKTILNDFENAQIKLEESGIKPSPSSIVTRQGSEYKQSLFGFTNHQYKLLIQKEQLNYAKHFKSVFKKLKDYTTEVLNEKDLLFSEITVGFLNEYEAYLKTIGNKTNTIAKNLRIIRAVINDAIIEDIIPYEKNPFHKYSIKKEATHKIALTEVEVRRIENADLEVNTSLWHVRNYFLFSYYCAGIRASDFIQLKWSNIVDGRLIYIMGKNKKQVNIKLNDKAKSILDFYSKSSKKDSLYIFPLLPNQVQKDKLKLLNLVNSKNVQINKDLKRLALKLSIYKSLSFHIARHSFSDISRTKGADLYSISKALNHSNLKITEAYLASFDQDAADSLVENL